ncbi:MAG: NAD(P)-binding domain-containing protein [Ignavibacteriales bacterium]|nr:MAG: NAD(P)-binding domain-containing protein [Ignavibacteriales bacterium]
MNIAIIGTGNVGGALAANWAKAGHTINLGVKDVNNFKGKALLGNRNTRVYTIAEAVKISEVILIATPPAVIFDLLEMMGDVSGKIIIDSTNAVMKRPEPYATVYHCLSDKTKAEVVKCFNSTGYENMLNPVYNGEGIDMFMAGSSQKAKDTARQLALDCGFGTCWDFGKEDKVELLEKFALSWINLAIMQGHGRDIALRFIRRT